MQVRRVYWYLHGVPNLVGIEWRWRRGYGPWHRWIWG